jgi:hypothetical protein
MWHLRVNHEKESCPFQPQKKWLHVLNDPMNYYNHNPFHWILCVKWDSHISIVVTNGCHY